MRSKQRDTVIILTVIAVVLGIIVIILAVSVFLKTGSLLGHSQAAHQSKQSDITASPSFNNPDAIRHVDFANMAWPVWKKAPCAFGADTFNAHVRAHEGRITDSSLDTDYSFDPYMIVYADINGDGYDDAFVPVTTGAACSQESFSYAMLWLWDPTTGTVKHYEEIPYYLPTKYLKNMVASASEGAVHISVTLTQEGSLTSLTSAQWNMGIRDGHLVRTDGQGGWGGLCLASGKVRAGDVLYQESENVLMFPDNDAKKVPDWEDADTWGYASVCAHEDCSSTQPQSGDSATDAHPISIGDYTLIYFYRPDSILKEEYLCGWTLQE
ncbi:MAG: hypothetical protein Q4P66_04070 [Actinomycetaceae bacterium]|nr:hypothetical protein [Actinomycetaceae bacterium]